MITETLEVAWNGTLDHDRTAGFSLSTYIGRSSLPPHEEDDAEPVPSRARKYADHPRDAEVFVLIQKGVSYRNIAKDTSLTLSTVRRIAARHGVDRSKLAK